MAKVEEIKEEQVQQVQQEEPSFRAKLVQFLHTLNVMLIMLSSFGFIFFTSFLIPGISNSAAAVTGVRVSGVYGVVYALMIKSLGPQNHAQYCLTFVLHFLLACTYGFEAAVQRENAGTDQWNRLAFPSLIHLSLFAVMFGLLVNGGLGGGKKHAKKEQ